MIKKFKLKKGDEVIVISGKDKGKKGKIIANKTPVIAKCLPLLSK